MNILGSENINESLQTHFLIYKIKNNVNGKYYIGQHKTEDPYDDYMGSGCLLHKAYNKYNLSCFTKEILFDFDNFEDMNNKEKELVPLSACYPNNPMCYNIQEGGKQHNVNDITKQVIKKQLLSYWETLSTQEKENFSITCKNGWKNRTLAEKENFKHKRKLYWQNISEEDLQNFKRLRSKLSTGKNNGMYGKNPWANLSEQRKSEIRKEASKRAKGSKNPMFKYPYELVVQMRDEYNKNGYVGVKTKYNYTATEGTLLNLFFRNNISTNRKSKHHIYTNQELLDAIKMINKYGFEYYANYANTIYAFKPSFNNFKACLKRCNLINKLNIKKMI